MIRTFTNPIYPRCFWVATVDDIDVVCKRFMPNDEIPLTEERLGNSSMKSVNCYEKATGNLGYLVIFLRSFDENELVRHISHEAAHCAVWLCADLGIGASETDSEALAYAVGYFADCMYKTISRMK